MKTIRTVLGLLATLCCSLSVHATTVQPPEFDELVNKADYIVKATVVSVTAELRTRADGTSGIYTSIELAVERTIAGSPPSKVVLRTLGGKLNGQELRISGAPTYEVGDRGIFFVQGNGTQAYPLVRMMHGLYRVEHDTTNRRDIVTRADRTPLTDVSEVSRPMEGPNAHGTAPRSVASARALSPEDFELRIKARVSSAHLRAK